MEQSFVHQPSKKLKIVVKSGTDEVHLDMDGVIDADFDKEDLLEMIQKAAQASANRVGFDLRKLTVEGRTGIHKWCDFMRGVQDMRTVRFTAIGESWVGYFGAVPNVLGKPGSPIERVDVPFYYAKGEERFVKSMSVVEGATNPDGWSPPAEVSPESGKPAEFDGILEEYRHLFRNTGPTAGQAAA